MAKNRQIAEKTIDNFSASVKIMLELIPIILVIGGLVGSVYGLNNFQKSTALNWSIITFTFILFALLFFSIQYNINNKIIRIKLLFIALFLVLISLLTGVFFFATFLPSFNLIFILFLILFPNFWYLSESSLFREPKGKFFYIQYYFRYFEFALSSIFLVEFIFYASIITVRGIFWLLIAFFCIIMSIYTELKVINNA